MLNEGEFFAGGQSGCPDPLDKIICGESAAALRKAVGALPEAYSLPLVMRHYKGMSLQEISNTLDLPLSTVKWRIHAAKIKIREALRKEGQNE
ncbi:MAG: hypothetical protein FWE82_06100 [Defluviitaleaceae bacterium]|nr:hypothetical protein [Defluviitaleaceae bacterium]